MNTKQIAAYRVIGSEVFDERGISLYRFSTRSIATDVCDAINQSIQTAIEKARKDGYTEGYTDWLCHIASEKSAYTETPRSTRERGMKEPHRIQKPLQVVMFTLPWKQLPDYPDVGSYRMNADNSPAVITCADTFNDVSNAAVLLHEFIESFLCWIHGISEYSIREFDQKWFAEGAAGIKHTHESPGDDPAAPYHEWHLVALRFEREFVLQNGMTWEEHELNIDRVFPTAIEKATDVEQLRAECDHYKMLTQELGQELRAARASEEK